MSDKQQTAVVCVTGCIAAYKACEVVRGLQKAGCDVRVAMTSHATAFLGPLTMQALTGHPVATNLFDGGDDPIAHITLGQSADVLAIVPCTANMLAKMAAGIADDLVSSTALAATCPVVVAPAMNVHMYEHPATQANLETLAGRGVRIVEPDEGYLACHDTGKGRLPEPAAIVEAILGAMGAEPESGGGTAAVAGATDATDAYDAACGSPDTHETSPGAGRDMEGLRVMVTAGPTREPIDPVRYLSNHSSGTMGYACAQAALKRGAKVTLVSGPVSLEAPAKAHLVKVTTAREMLAAAERAFEDCDIAVFTAAVADMAPAHPSDRKLKKGIDDRELSAIELVANPDILATLARKKGERIVVGFAAETDDVAERATEKLVRKGADLIVGNQVGQGKGFGAVDNDVWLVDAAGRVRTGPLPKAAIADIIFDKCLTYRS